MRTTLRMVASTLVLATLATIMPQFASPASAAPIIHNFATGDIIKIKTTWGGGWVANFGGTEGSKLAGRIAQVHWNFSWDHVNRFEVLEEGPSRGSLRFYKLKNRHSKLCLAATQLWGQGYVTQQSCDSSDSSRYWAAVNGLGDDMPIRNLAFEDSNLAGFVMTQAVAQHVGSHIWMEKPAADVDGIRQRWILQTCKVGGSQLKDC